MPPRAARRLLISLAIASASMSARAHAASVRLEAHVPGLGMVNERFMVAVPIANAGVLDANDVAVTAVSLASAPLLAPSSFPVVLGLIAAGGEVVFQGDFDAQGLQPQTRYPLAITGTSGAGRSRSR